MVIGSLVGDLPYKVEPFHVFPILFSLILIGWKEYSFEMFDINR